MGRKVMFTMYDYLEDILAEELADFDGENITPAASDLFQVNGASWRINMATADLFYCIIVKFLYVAKRARPDLQVTVAFLCKQIKCINIDDWKKLCRLVQYVRATIHLSLILGSEGRKNMVWSINASFPIHKDMKCHTGYCFTLGKVSPISGSSGQKSKHKESNWIKTC